MAIVIDKTFDVINALLIEPIADLTGAAIFITGAPPGERAAAI